MRSPLFPHDQFSDLFKDSEGDLIEAIKGSIAEAAISLGAPEFAKKLKTPAARKAPQKFEDAVLKYLLRMSRRTTPFGIFSGYSVGTWGSYTDIRFKQQAEWCFWANPDGAEILSKIEEQNSETIFSINPGLQIFSNKLKNIGLTGDALSSTPKYSVLEIDCSKHLAKALTTLGQKHQFSKKQALRELQGDVGVFRSLKEKGLIIPLNSYGGYFVNSLKGGSGPQGLTDPREIAAKAMKSPRINAILKKETISCQLDQKVSQQVGRGIQILMRLFSNHIRTKQFNTYVGRFAQKFFDIYCYQEIPFLEALDPTSGVMDQFFVDPPKKESTEFESYLIKKIFHGNKMVEEIVLTNEDIDRLESLDRHESYRVAKIPPAMMAFVDVCGSQVHLKMVGDPLGTQFLSRFANHDSDLSEKVQKVFDRSQKISEGVIYAEILDRPRDRIKVNLSTRKIRTEYVIPIENQLIDWPASKQIDLSDLMISAHYGRVRLRSKRLNKEIVPIFSSACDYSSDPHPYFRFLAALSSQQYFRFLHWDWKSLYQWSYLPRVRYRNILFSLREWKLNSEDLKFFGGSKRSCSEITEFLRSRGIPEKFNLVQMDDQLLFVDTKFDRSVQLFKAYAAGQKDQVVIREELREPEPGQYVTEYMLPFQRVENIKRDPHSQLDLTPTNLSSRDRYINFNRKCFNFKLFTNSAHCDSLLTHEIAELAADLDKLGILKNWFFIRYADPDPHLRIRFFLKKNNDLAQVQSLLMPIIDRLYENQEIWNFQVETFRRDLEGEDLLNQLLFEQMSYIDSERAIDALRSLDQSHWSKDQNILYGVVLMDRFLSLTGWTLNEKSMFAEVARSSYLTAGSPPAAQLVSRMNEFHRKNSSRLCSLIVDGPGRLYPSWESHFENFFRRQLLVFQKVWAANQDRKTFLGNKSNFVLRSIHMALNRSFNGLQYSEEDQMYGLLYKTYTSIEKNSKVWVGSL